jgi:hypothetical protein
LLWQISMVARGEVVAGLCVAPAWLDCSSHVQLLLWLEPVQSCAGSTPPMLAVARPFEHTGFCTPAAQPVGLLCVATHTLFLMLCMPRAISTVVVYARGLGSVSSSTGELLWLPVWCLAAAQASALVGGLVPAHLCTGSSTCVLLPWIWAVVCCMWMLPVLLCP